MTTQPIPTSKVDGTRVDRLLTAFYLVVAVVALAGQTGAAASWLGWTMLFAFIAVAAVEFGGIALAAYADHRRRLGERAVFARLLSAAVAAGAVLVNWFGHPDAMQAGFFAGMSALGYLVWLLHSGARRRDQLRAAGTLPPVPPVYGLGQWARHPNLTRHARTLALVDPSLGLYGSLDAARTARRVQRRQAAIAKALHRKITEAVDPLTAEIATATFDLDEIADRLARNADYDGLTALISADLTPHRLTTNRPTQPTTSNAGTADPGPTGPAQPAHTATPTITTAPEPAPTPEPEPVSTPAAVPTPAELAALITKPRPNQPVPAAAPHRSARTTRTPANTPATPAPKLAPSATDTSVTEPDAAQLTLPIVSPQLLAQARQVATQYRTEHGTPITQGQLAVRLKVTSEQATQALAVLDLDPDSPTHPISTVNGRPVKATR